MHAQIVRWKGGTAIAVDVKFLAEHTAQLEGSRFGRGRSNADEIKSHVVLHFCTFDSIATTFINHCIRVAADICEKVVLHKAGRR